jgi:hypothetical protein
MLPFFLFVSRFFRLPFFPIAVLSGAFVSHLPFPLPLFLVPFLPLAFFLYFFPLPFLSQPTRICIDGQL